tara:strand:+ start:19835 stop:20377 length:543 start_codon:yes stop_codon:yes gene_type:complete
MAHSEEIQSRAEELFVKYGLPYKGVQKRIIEESDVTVSMPTLYNWASKSDWKTQRQEYESHEEYQVLEKISEVHAPDVLTRTDRHMDIYQQLSEKAAKYLGLDEDEESKEGKDFEKARDAVQTLDIAIKGERAIQAGIIHQQFIQTVLSVIVEVVKDESTLIELGTKLKLALASYSEEGQ